MTNDLLNKTVSIMISVIVTLICLIVFACGDQEDFPYYIENNPKADAGPDQIVSTGSAVSLDGSMSLDGSGNLDPEGDMLDYSWSFVSKPVGSSATLSIPTDQKPAFTADVDGIYDIQLIVDDGISESAPDSVVITATTANVPPIANAGPDQAVIPGSLVELDGSGSSDANNDPLTYRWSFVSIPEGSTSTLSSTTDPQPTFTVDDSGIYEIQLVVNDGTADSNVDGVVITANTAPIADAGPDQNITAEETVDLDGSGSTDADGDNLTYSWSFISMPTGSSATLSDSSAVTVDFTADIVGDYEIQLIVSDGIASDDDSAKITSSCYGVLDLVLLQDLSSSFNDDMVKVKSLAPDISDQLTATGYDTKLGLVSFIDKPISPHGDPTGDYVFQIELALTNEKTDFQTAVDGLTLGNGGDFDEAQLEALMHIGKQSSSIGFRDGAERFVVLLTDALFHRGEDNDCGSCAIANNDDSTTDANEGYPTISQVAQALADNNIIPIFAIADDTTNDAKIAGYQQLVTDLVSNGAQEGTVVELSSDSSDIIEVILAGINCAGP